MEHRQLRIFRVLARTLSFTRAAAELGYVQSNVTAQVQALERELGVRLFDRLGATVTNGQIASCKSLKGATMLKGEKYEDWLKTPEGQDWVNKYKKGSGEDEKNE